MTMSYTGSAPVNQHKEEDALRGRAVKNQKAIWDKTLEMRFLLQKAFSTSNKLPQVSLSVCRSKHLLGLFIPVPSLMQDRH